MGWARFDDCYADHPKLVAAGPMAQLLDMRAILYCARHETDGRVPRETLGRLGLGIPAYRKLVDKLIAVGRWEPVEGGWMIHDYLEYNPSRAQKLSDRAWQAKARELHSTPGLVDAIKTRDGDHCRYCGGRVSWKDRRGPRGATYDHIVPRGENSLENLVVSCKSCNSKKGARTPDQAGMALLPPRSDLDPIQPPVPTRPLTKEKEKNNLPQTKPEDVFSTDFALLWEQYPRKVDKTAARKAYIARRREGIPHDRLVTAVSNYAVAVAGKDATYTKHGATFLGKDGAWSEWEAGAPVGTMKPYSMQDWLNERHAQ